MNNTKIIGGIVVLVTIVALSWIFIKGSNEQEVSRFDTTDTVGTFYAQWLKAAQDSTVVPNREALAESPILSKELRERLASTLKESGNTLDPVLCQTVVPDNFSSRTVYENESEAQILVMSRDKKVSEQATVTLLSHNDGWYINDIQCSAGEFEEEREFSFEREGSLLKGSVPAPYDSKNWHLVFEENGKLGHVAPLFFNSNSQCTALDGSKAICEPDQFKEAARVLIRGQMSESGVTVNQQEFIK